MPKWAIIARREIVETVRTKAFMISTILTPVLMGVMLFLPQSLARSDDDKVIRIGVIDRTGLLMAALDAELATVRGQEYGDYLRDGSRRFQLSAVGDGARDESGGLVNPGESFEKDGPAALLDIGAGVYKGDEDPRWYSRNVADFMPIRRVEKAINAILPRLRLAESGISEEVVRAGVFPIDLKTHKIGESGRAEESEFGKEWMKAMLLAVSLYAPTLMAGFALSRGLLEEKANRVIEVLISSVSPLELMTGKILGQALVVLGQIAVWMIAGSGVTLYMMKAGDTGPTAQILASFNPTLLAWLALYFLLGYLLYAALFAAVGAICTSELEAQQVQTPIVLMLVLPMILAIMMVRQPSGRMATILSLIPFTAPNAMMIRLALQPPPAWQIILSLTLLTLTILLAFWAVSRIFRVGILMTGKRMTAPEILRWIRAR